MSLIVKIHDFAKRTNEYVVSTDPKRFPYCATTSDPGNALKFETGEQAIKALEQAQEYFTKVTGYYVTIMPAPETIDRTV